MAKRAMEPKGLRKLTRAEKSRKIKEDLFHAAAKVVGEVGYANALVSKITEAANVAQGTFYNHFESRQNLFDELLPSLGAELLDFIRVKAGGAPNATERERLSFLAFFEFIKIKPEFYRILYEAEIFAPRAFQIHMDRIADAYVRTLERDLAKGELALADRNELEALAFSLMGARHYLCMRFARRNGRTVSLPDWVVDAYMQLVTEGVYRARNAQSSG